MLPAVLSTDGPRCGTVVCALPPWRLRVGVNRDPVGSGCT